VLALANRSADAHADAAPARACVRLAEPPLRHRASTSEELPAVAALPADAAPTAKAADMDNAATEASEACCARPRGRSRGSRGRRRSSRRSFGRAPGGVWQTPEDRASMTVSREYLRPLVTRRRLALS